MAELFIRNSSVGCIKSLIFDKDGTLSNSEKYLLKLAKTRIKFAEKKFSNLKINKIKILILRKLLLNLYGIAQNSLLPNAIMAIASREQNILSTATVFSLFGFNWFNSLSISHQIFDEADIFLSNQIDHKPKTKCLISGALDLLEALKSEGITVALMTNDTNAGIKEFIMNNKLYGLFDYLWSAEDQPNKPNPMAVIELCKKMDLKPSECALISDADTDLKMAKQADIAIAIGFTGGWVRPPILSENHFLIEKLNELKIHENT
tara:strand:+ start:2115 stop:2903 length:789 start_codon:yes stop_codon:yes gene_type:complete